MAGIFKAYDVRSVFGQDLNNDVGYQIGKAFAMYLGSNPKIVCARDGRVHSPGLQAAFIRGAQDAGADVTDMGLATSPSCYFACFTDHFDGAAVITASHNSGEYNGIKMTREKAIPLTYEKGMKQIEEMVNSGQAAAYQCDQPGTITQKDYKPAYLDFLFGKLEGEHPFHYAVDCGNGMGGHLIEDFQAGTHHRVEPLYWDLDFTFPNHLANPLDFRNLEDLRQKVVTEKLDFGVAFDGDADRCFFVDDQGEVIPADILTTLLAKQFLTKRGPSPIVYDVRSSRVVAEEVTKLGGTPILCRVGHSFMKAELRKSNGHFGGELAGHFYFKDFSFADSAFLTMVEVMNILTEKKEPLSKLIAPLKRYVPSGEVNFETTKADQLLQECPSKFPGGEVLTIDGIRIDFPDWWFCLRKSNTEPLLRLVVEATQQEKLDSALEAIKKWLFSEGATIH
ncbi:MAG: phosphomannomutase/phosphoglucomutase [Acidobacteria bacterium]|nr:MAG: phosphomannomutase/phosphoglucomutase [Acidobacteriota bacterium]